MYLLTYFSAELQPVFTDIIVLFVVIAVVKTGSKLTDNDWNQHLVSCLAEAENFQPPSEIFAVRSFRYRFACICLSLKCCSVLCYIPLPLLEQCWRHSVTGLSICTSVHDHIVNAN